MLQQAPESLSPVDTPLPPQLETVPRHAMLVEDAAPADPLPRHAEAQPQHAMSDAEYKVNYSKDQLRVAGGALLESARSAAEVVTEPLTARFESVKQTFQSTTGNLIGGAREKVSGFRGFLRDKANVARAKRDSLVARAKSRAGGVGEAARNAATVTAEAAQMGAVLMVGAGVVAAEMSSEFADKRKAAFKSSLHTAVEAARGARTEVADMVVNARADLIDRRVDRKTAKAEQLDQKARSLRSGRMVVTAARRASAANAANLAATSAAKAEQVA